MADAPPRLITFAISHYCEKARWALDWHKIAYREIGWPPGLHRILAKRAGAKVGSVPILLGGNEVIEGSDQIIDWAEARPGGPILCPATHEQEIRDVEQRLDRKTGVHVRRLVYAHVFPDKAHYVKPLLFANTSLAHRIAGNLMWPACKKLIVKAYKLTGNAAAESRAVLEAEFDHFEQHLANSGQYLIGDQFTRADVTAASLLAPFARPDEMPLYRDARFPDDLTAIVDEWSQRPIMAWARDIYARHRRG